MRFIDFKKHFEIDISEVLRQSIEETKQDVINYNQKEQLSEGIDAKGQRIETIASQEQNTGYPYGRMSVSKRGARGLQVDNVDLNITGAFWSSFDVKVTRERTEVLADWNIHGDDIRDNFDKRFDFLGLTNNSKENYVWSSLFPVFSRRLRKSVLSGLI
jgi:hypothetical protein